VHFSEAKIFPLWGVVGVQCTSIVNLGPTHISETIRAKKLKFYTHLNRAMYSFRVRQFFRYGACVGGAAPLV